MGGGGGADHAHGASHGHVNGGDFRTKVWSLTGGPYCRPKHWKRNTAIAMFGIVLVCIPIAMKSAELEVISETLRLGNAVSDLHRKALVSSRFEGCDIPKGWSVILLFSGTLLDGEVYYETERFNPWRWQRTSINKAMVQNYMPFSQGPRQCPGMGLAKMEMAIFLHYLVLKYDWELMSPGEQPFSRNLFLEFSRGMLLKIHHLPPNLPEKYVL